MRALSVSIERDHQAAVVHLRGDLDIAGVADLRRRLQLLLDLGCDRLELDLSALTFCDVPGVRFLLDFARAADERDATLEIRGAGGQVQRILDLTKAGGVLPLAM